MKRKVFVWLLCAEAMICIALHILQSSLSGSFLDVIAFPFEQIGQGLRYLSLANGLGNAIAIIIYLMISLSPIAVLFAVRKKRRLIIEDGLLVIFSIVLFAVLYMMINPGSIGFLPSSTFSHSIEKVVAGSTAYSVLCGYIILRLLRQFSTCGTDKLIRYMMVMLLFLNVLFVYMVFGVCLGNLFDNITTLRAGNIGNEHLLSISFGILLLQFAVDSLPLIFNILVVFAALKLLGVMKVTRFSSETVFAAKHLSRLCYVALVATILVGMGFNILQLVFAKSLMIFNTSVQIPLFSIIFMCVTLLFAQIVKESKQLKDDNDMFV